MLMKKRRASFFIYNKKVLNRYKYTTFLHWDYTTMIMFFSIILDNVNIKGYQYTSALVGNSSSSTLTITNVAVSGTVQGTSGYVGGLIGNANKAVVSNSYSTATVTGAGPYTGGLAGRLSGGTASRCYASGNILSTEGSYTGCLIGYQTATLTDVYALGDINANGYSYVGGLVGRQYGDITNATVTNIVSKTQSFKAVLYLKNSEKKTLGKVDKMIDNLEPNASSEISIEIMGD